ncbi:hypothetical protein [Nostoc sp. UHCC 0870]|uniref:hypothetical protein n=1 Tax=Nostoc sp. UHCC 0870 TaxID=2914041 RepID=UPI001EDFCC2F|nr:hypothetical protein [Nostoc sp. UHCC 0870]UKO96366.1 hypothetical protein L6494_17210 [Nostoc sp. UHCC 0870]
MSSGRYQSRLFNLVHQQSRRLTTQWESTFRHLQVATKWGVELILYPVYLFLQSADSSVKILYSKAPPTQPKLSPNHPSADTPIQHILEAVQHLPKEETTVTSRNISKLLKPLQSFWAKFFDHPTNKSDISQPLTIPNKTAPSIIPSNQHDILNCHLSVVRGIGTDLLNRQLVLVSIENQILDILTPQQQAKLSDRIISELANYFQDLHLPENHPKAKLLAEFERVFTKLTGKNIVKLPFPTESILNLLNTSKIIPSLDTAFAQLEAKTILPSQEIMRVTQTQINIFVYGKEQLAARGDIAVTADSLEAQKFNISALIEAAVNYFFSIGKSKNLNARGAKDKALSNSNQEPWLNWSDLYGDTANIAEEKTQASLKINPAIVPSPTSKTDSNLLSLKKQPSHLTRLHQTSGKITTIKQTQTAISPLKTDSERGQISSQQLDKEEIQPDWIETKATSVSYEKHILEQILELLDRAMVWLEERVVKIFQKLQSLWRGK